MVREEARDGGLEAGSRHSVWSLEPPGPRSACFWSLRWSRWMYFFASAVSKGSEALPGRWTMAAALATVSSRCHVLSDVISWKRRATHFGLGVGAKNFLPEVSSGSICAATTSASGRRVEPVLCRVRCRVLQNGVLLAPLLGVALLARGDHEREDEPLRVRARPVLAAPPFGAADGLVCLHAVDGFPSVPAPGRPRRAQLTPTTPGLEKNSS